MRRLDIRLHDLDGLLRSNHLPPQQQDALEIERQAVAFKRLELLNKLAKG